VEGKPCFLGTAPQASPSPQSHKDHEDFILPASEEKSSWCSLCLCGEGCRTLSAVGLDHFDHRDRTRGERERDLPFLRVQRHTRNELLQKTPRCGGSRSGRRE